MNKPRLIDANFIEQYVTREEHKTPDEKWRPESEFVALIDNAPTAYDLDKVVEQLEEMFYCNEYCQKKFYQGLGCKACLFGKVIEVVKGGGKHDD